MMNDNIPVIWPASTAPFNALFDRMRIDRAQEYMAGFLVNGLFAAELAALDFQCNDNNSASAGQNEPSSLAIRALLPLATRPPGNHTMLDRLKDYLSEALHYFAQASTPVERSRCLIEMVAGVETHIRYFHSEALLASSLYDDPSDHAFRLAQAICEKTVARLPDLPPTPLGDFEPLPPRKPSRRLEGLGLS